MQVYAGAERRADDYGRLLDALPRRNDTFYVVSFHKVER